MFPQLFMRCQTGFTVVRAQGIHSLERYCAIKRTFITLLGTYLSREFLTGGILMEAIG
jgi:hypothetical protein